jgi:hypothetical protein
MNRIASQIYEEYRKRFDSTQGLCAVIAKEIIDIIGGEPVAGYLTWYGGSCRRSHWWVEKDGEIIDPMGDDFLKDEEAIGREEIHRNLDYFFIELDRQMVWI